MPDTDTKPLRDRADRADRSGRDELAAARVSEAKARTAEIAKDLEWIDRLPDTDTKPLGDTP